MSAAALLAALAALPGEAAAGNAPPAFSSQWVKQQAAAARSGSSGSLGTPSNGITATQAQQIQRSVSNLNQAAALLRGQLAGQAAARAAAAQSSGQVLDGLATAGYDGGLKVHPEINQDPDSGIVWTGADLPTQTQDANGTTVSIKQTERKAVLSWERFDVGAKTTLAFQQDSQDWTVLNRVVAGTDPATGARIKTNPSQILGKITAPGSVYIINQNGIIFGGSSQVNVNTLIASSLDIGLPYQTLRQRNEYFLNGTDQQPGTLSFSFSLLRDAQGDVQGELLTETIEGTEIATNFVPRAEPLEGDVVVEKGARIETPVLSRDDPYLGRVVLAAPRVINSGQIETPDGQTILVGARNFSLVANDTATVDALNTLHGWNTFADAAQTIAGLRGAQVYSGDADFLTVGDAVSAHVTRSLTGSQDVFTAEFDIPAGSIRGGPSFDAPLADIGTGLSASNAGLIGAARGNVTFQSQNIDVSGSVYATTATNANGSILVKAQNIVLGTGTLATPENRLATFTLGSGGLLTVLPDADDQGDGSTAPEDQFQTDALLGGTRQLPSTSQALAQFARSVIDIRGDSPLLSQPRDASEQNATLTFQTGSLVYAPSATVTIATYVGQPPEGADGRYERTLIPNIVVQDGAAIDASGLMDVTRTMESNVVTVDRVGLNELADSPLLRSTFLAGYRGGITVDRRLSGTRSDGVDWVGTPLFNAAGSISSAGVTVAELVTSGGSIAFDGITHVEKGSTVSVAGGYLRFLGGYIKTTKLFGPGGSIIDIGSADPNFAYSGVAGLFVDTHARWGVTKYYPVLLGDRGRFEQGYVQGADAGTLTFTGAALIEGALDGGAIAGPYQRSDSGAYASSPPSAGTLDLSGLEGLPNYTFADDSEIVPADEVADFNTRYGEQVWSAEALSDSGFSTLRFGGTRLSDSSTTGNAGSTITVTKAANLVLPAGGSLTLSGETIDVAGSITAHGGSVTFELLPFYSPRFVANASSELTLATTPRTSFTLEPGASIDLSGLWINDFGASRDTLIGSDYVDGGALTIRDASYTADSFVPDFAAITLAAGSRINLNSGGYVSRKGVLKLDDDGVPVGTGGDLAILLHLPQTTPAGSSALLDRTVDSDQYLPGTVQTRSGGYLFLDPDSPAGADARILIDDTLVLASDVSAFGFQGGGEFALRAPEIRIGALVLGQELGGKQGRFTITPDFINGHGFGSVTLTGLLRTSVDAGTTLSLTQQQLVPTTAAPLATTLAEAAVAGVPAGTQRRPQNLTLAGLGWSRLALNDDAVGIETRNALTIGAGSTIQGEPGAAITLAGQGQVTLQPGVTISAPGGSVDVLQRYLSTPISSGTSTALKAQAYLSLYIDDSVRISTNGTFVADPLSLQYRNGDVLDGGSISVDANVLIGKAGAVFSASGTAATLDLPQLATGFPGQAYVATTVGSDAGSISLRTTDQTAFDSALLAQPGTSTNAGGTLTVSGTNVTLTGETATVPEDIQPLDTLPEETVPRDVFVLSTARLAGNGIDVVSITATDEADGRIAFSGSPTLSVGRSLEVSARQFVWLPEDSVDPAGASGAPTLDDRPFVATLSAPYLRIANTTANTPSAPATISRVTDPLSGASLMPGAGLVLGGGANGALTVDIAGNVSLYNFGAVDIEAAGDVRFVSGPASSEADPSAYYSGVATAGDLTITAAQVYSATAVSALLQSLAGAASTAADDDGGTITIRSNGNAAPVPLSAGGRLILSARTIVQEGVLRAPLGTIQLGVASDATVIPTQNRFSSTVASTQSVTLADGSLTSVSADGLSIPYGWTAEQQDWTYFTDVLSAPPEKRIVVDSAAASLATGAVVDLSGGGEVYASEFIPGTGGSRDVLYANLTTASQPVYAILPGAQQAAVAASDPQAFDTASAASAVQSSTAGLTLTLLTDMPGGLKAGTYTLYPAQYATLPGAYRVEMVPNSVDTPSALVVGQPDGSYQVAGRLGYSGTSILSGRTSAWLVQSSSTWRQYSEVVSTTASSYFSQLATQNDTVIPRLPIDAGRLVLAVTNRLALGATVRFAAADGGRGGEADIAAPGIAVVSDLADAPADFLAITPEGIRTLNADSLLLGGTRSTENDGTQIDIVAGDILIDTTAADPLQNRELVLAAHATSTQPGSIRIADGSVIQALGADREDAAASYLLGTTTTTGDGALLTLTTSVVPDVTRTNLPSSPQGVIEFGSGVIIAGRSLLLDAAGTVDLAPSANLFVRALSLSTDSINFGTVPAGTSGTIIAPNQIASLGQTAESLLFRARSELRFFGQVVLGSLATTDMLSLAAPAIIGADDAEVSLAAREVSIGSDVVVPDRTVSAGSGRFTASSETMDLAAANQTFSGFSPVTLAASQMLRIGDEAIGSTVDVPTPVTPATAPVVAGTIGFVLLDEATVTNNKLTLPATIGYTNAVVFTLASGSAVVLPGGSTTFLDDPINISENTVKPVTSTLTVTRFQTYRLPNASSSTAFGAPNSKPYTLPAGTIVYVSPGNVTLPTGTAVNITTERAPQITTSGVLTLDAPVIVAASGATQTLKAAGAVSAVNTAGAIASLPDDLGGKLTVDAGGAVSIATTIAARSGVVDLRARTNDLIIAASGTIRADGYTQAFVDTTKVLPGGSVELRADTGNVRVDPGALIDVSADPGGNGGALSVVVAAGTGTFSAASGTLDGSADADRYGSDFVLDAAGAVDLPTLLPVVASFNDRFSVHSGSGNLVVAGGSLLRARAVSLDADGGVVQVGGAITVDGYDFGDVDVSSTNDAQKVGGGTIDLYGRSGVTLLSGAQLLARSGDRDHVNHTQRGGQVNIGTTGQGVLDLEAGAVIDVSGGSPYGSDGGTVHLRTPLLAGDTIDPATSLSATVTGANAAILEPYVSTDIADGDLSQSDWNMILGNFDARFSPAVVQALTAAVPGYLIQPGLELTSRGNLSINSLVLDFGADTTAAIVRTGWAHRYGASQQPGWFTVRAGGTLSIDSSISDGFLLATSDTLVSGQVAQTRTAKGTLDTVTYDQVTSGVLPDGVSSWSYRFTAGADLASADPLGVVRATPDAIATAAAAQFRFGDRNYNPQSTTQPLGRNDILRTGTGSIEIAAAGDIRLLNPSSVIYTAGVGIIDIPEFEDTPLELTGAIATSQTSAGVRAVSSTSGPGAGLAFTTPVFATLGGDLRFTAGGNLVGHQNVTDETGKLTGRTATAGSATYIGQVFTPWLFYQGYISPTPDSTGLFGGLGYNSATSGTSWIDDGRQSASSVVTGTFQQGIAALGGGDVTVRTGGAIKDTAISVVSTYAVSGGKTAGVDDVAMHRFGGGNLRVDSGGDVSSSIFYVGKGSSRIDTRGGLTAGYQLAVLNTVPGSSFGTLITGAIPLGNTLAMGDASFDIAARTDVSIGRVISEGRLSRWAYERSDPDGAAGRTYTAAQALLLQSSPYEDDNALVVVSAGGDIGLQKDLFASALYGGGNRSATYLQTTPSGQSTLVYRSVGENDWQNYLPPSTSLTAARGGLTIAGTAVIASSSDSNLEVLAQNDINLYAYTGVTGSTIANGSLLMLTIDPQVLSTPLHPNATIEGIFPANPVSTALSLGYHLDSETVTFTDDNTVSSNNPGLPITLDRFSLHAEPAGGVDESEPVRIISLEGSIISGAGLDGARVEGAADGTFIPRNANTLLYLDKQAVVWAGGDIANLTYTGLNNRSSDVSWIHAGRNITYSLFSTPNSDVPVPEGGSFVLGGPGTFIIDAGRDLLLQPSTADGQAYGVLSVANRIDPYLPQASADLQLLFGTAPGIDIAAFTDRYINPANAADVEQNYIAELIDYLKQRAEGRGEAVSEVSADEALALFRALPEQDQLPFVMQVYFDELRSVAPQPNSLVVVGPERAYQAIATLFPAGTGYTDQSADPILRVHTGDLDMLGAVVRTDYGGDIALVGPGGDALIGGLAVNDVPINLQGIFTLRGGSIDAYLDGNLTVNASRVLTLQGGDITVFSANGNIDAGRGRRTASFSPPLAVSYNQQVGAFVDFGGTVTGSGIGTLITLPGSAPGDIYLIAPRGEIDAGEAGIRSSGNLFVLAQTIVNAANIDVGGATVGIQSNTGASASTLSAGQNTQAGLGQEALDQVLTAAGQPAARLLPSIINVEVIGYGEGT